MNKKNILLHARCPHIIISSLHPAGPETFFLLSNGSVSMVMSRHPSSHTSCSQWRWSHLLTFLVFKIYGYLSHVRNFLFDYNLNCVILLTETRCMSVTYMWPLLHVTRHQFPLVLPLTRCLFSAGNTNTKTLIYLDCSSRFDPATNGIFVFVITFRHHQMPSSCHEKISRLSYNIKSLTSTC